MSERELTPQQEEQVRRLLAEARHDEPIPADVAEHKRRAYRCSVAIIVSIFMREYACFLLYSCFYRVNI